MSPEKGDGSEALVLQTGGRPGRLETQGDPEIINYAFWLRKQGRSERTIEDYCRMLKQLAKLNASLEDPESVKEVLANTRRSNAWKASAIAAYSSFLRMKNLSWQAPRVEVTRKMPFIPTEEEIDSLIAGCGPKTSCLLQLLKETGMRIGEALRLRWSDVDFQRRVIILNQPEKHGNPRIFRISDKLMGMLNRLDKANVRIFPARGSSLPVSFYRSRRRLAAKLNNPRLLKIGLHTLRHWKATMEYHRTKDILRVKELLGHRSLDNTMLYIQVEKSLFNDDNDEFIVKTAKTPEEIKSLLEAGFEYVCEKDGLMFFRRRK